MKHLLSTFDNLVLSNCRA